MRSFIRDALIVMRALPEVEFGRLFFGPAPLVKRVRGKGRAGVRRTQAERRQLRNIIGAIDRCLPGGRNCYRRALLEMAIDPVTAATELKFGLRHGGGHRSGHAWLADDLTADRYDAEFSV